MSLARVFRKAGPDGQGPLRAAALPDRPEPALAHGRGDDERRRLRDRLVRPATTPGVFHSIEPAWNDRNLRELAGHIASPSSSPTSARRRERRCSRRTATRSATAWLWMHNGVIRDSADQARPRARGRSRRSIRSIEGSTDSEVLFFLALTLRPRGGSAGRGRAARSGWSRRSVSQHGVEHPVPGDDRDDGRRAALGVPLLERGQVALALLLDHVRDARGALPRRPAPRRSSMRRRGWSSPSHSATCPASGTRCLRRATGSSSPARTSCTRSNRWYPRTSHSRRLNDSRRASQEPQARARRVGTMLAPNETWAESLSRGLFASIGAPRFELGTSQSPRLFQPRGGRRRSVVRSGLNAPVAGRKGSVTPYASVSPFSAVWARIGHRHAEGRGGPTIPWAA